MKKLLSTMVVFLLLLNGCAAGNNAYTVHEHDGINLRSIDHDVNLNSDGVHLVYDEDTNIVYLYERGYYSIMCPYYSENGHMCRYNPETKTIEEIN